MLTHGGACLDVCFMQYLGLCLPVRQTALRLFTLVGKKDTKIKMYKKEGLRDRNSPMCTLSQNGYGARVSRKHGPLACFKQQREQKRQRARERETREHEGPSFCDQLVAARTQATSREILLWMTPSEAPKALQASECSELLDPMRASCWISAQH